MCLGWRFAMVEAILAIIMIYKDHTFDLPDYLVGKELDFNNSVTI